MIKLILVLTCVALYANGRKHNGKMTVATDSCNCDDQTDCDCSDHNLQSIPSTIPAGVRTLNLAGNSIENVTMIPEVSTLEKLNLSSNGIRSISYDSFDNLDNLEVLLLSHNAINRITDDIFEWNPLKLKVLKLDNNRLEFVQHFLFYDLDQLIELDLHNNLIEFIHPHAFSQLKSLLELRLDGNMLHTFNRRWFSSFSSDYINMLNLTGNLWSCDCAMSDQLDWLDRSDWIKKYASEAVCHQGAGTSQGDRKSLTDLTQDEANAFCDPPQITKISQNATVSVNQNLQLRCITEGIPAASIFWKAPNADTYNFHNADKFEGIEAHHDGTLVVRDLKMSDGGTYTCVASNKKGSVEATTFITVLPESASDEATKVVDMTSEVDEGTYQAASGECPQQCTCMTRNTDCASKNLDGVPSPVPADTITFNLASNNIRTITADNFNHLDKLEELRLDDNKISQIDSQVFNALTNLKTLTMRDNELREIPTFTELKKLQILVLDHNLLTDITDDDFEGLDSLQWLYLRNNDLMKISDAAFAPLVMTQYIHLEGNQIHYLSLQAIKSLTEPTNSQVAIKRIFVDQNDFYCDCEMNPLKSYLRSGDNFRKWMNLFGDGIICSYPSDLARQSLILIPETQKLICDENQTTVYVQKPVNVTESSTMTGLWFGGVVFGVVLCIAGLYAWGRRSRNSCFKKSYRSVGTHDHAEYSSLTASQSGGSEAFV